MDQSGNRSNEMFSQFSRFTFDRMTFDDALMPRIAKPSQFLQWRGEAVLDRIGQIIDRARRE